MTPTAAVNMSESKHARPYMPASFITAADRPVPARGIGLAIEPSPGIVAIKGKPEDAAMLAAISGVLGLEPPHTPRALAYGRQRALLWIAPDEWWILTSRDEAPALTAQLQTATAGCFAQIIDQSAAHTGFWLDGHVRNTVLRHLTAFDVDSMPTQTGAGIMLSRTRAHLVQPGIACMLILVGRSHAQWVHRRLREAARPYGLFEHER